MEIIYVCTGNTCRSPMAEGISRMLYGDSGNIFKSRGLRVFVPSQASPNSISEMHERGIDITGHVSAQLTLDDIKNADLILAMTTEHKNAIIKACPEAHKKVFTLGEYSKAADEIPDPFGGDLEQYRICADTIEKCVRNIDFKNVSLGE